MSSFPTCFLSNAISVCQAKLHHSLINVPAELFMLPFYAPHFCLPWCGCCLFILTVCYLALAYVCLPQPEVNVAWYYYFWNFFFCLREFSYSNNQVAFSDKGRVLLLLIPIVYFQSAIWSLRMEMLLLIYVFLIVLMQLPVLSIHLIQWKL